MTNLDELFNPVVAAETPAASDKYKVSFKNGVGGIYKSVIRFIPFYANPKKSVTRKNISWVKNPITNDGRYVDDPRSIGESSPVTDMYFRLYNTNIATYQDFAKKYLSTKIQYASLVQIIKDVQHPELVGQIKVFTYGQKLYDKINAEMTPQVGQGVNPFHPIYGRYFSLVCTEQSGFNNFDQSSFVDNKNAQQQTLPSGILIKNPQTDAFEIATEQTDKQVIADFLMTNSPDLAKYDYQPWTTEQTNFVNDVLGIISGYLQTGTLQSNLQSVNTAHSVASAPVVSSPVFPGATQQPASPTPQSAAVSVDIPAVAPKVSAPSAVEGLSIGTNLDDILKTL